MAMQAWVRQALEAHKAPYQELHHGLAFTSQHLAELEHVSGHQVAKVVVVIADGRPIEAVLPASRYVDLGMIRETVGANRCRLATEQEIAARFDGCEVGAMPPMRRWPGIDFLMDESLRTSGDIVFPAGTHRDAIRMKFDDWEDLVQPRIANFSREIGGAGRDTGVMADYEDWDV